MKISKFSLTDFGLLEEGKLNADNEQNDAPSESAKGNADNPDNPEFIKEISPPKLYTEEDLENAKKASEEAGYIKAQRALEVEHAQKLDHLLSDLTNIKEAITNLITSYDERLLEFENNLLSLYKNIIEKLGINSQERLLEIMQVAIKKNLTLLKESQTILFNVSENSYTIFAEKIKKIAEEAGLNNFNITKDPNILNSELQIIWKDGGIKIDAEEITNEVVKLLTNVIT